MRLFDPRRVDARGAVILCGIVATGLGFAYMAAGHAPLRYFAMNGGALAIGFALAAIVARLPARIGAGSLCLLLSLLLALSWAFGISVEGARRWVMLGNVVVQPSLILVPVTALCFTRARDAVGAAGIAVTALVLALQPDRAMAGALAAAMAALVIVEPDRNALVALGAALAGFAFAMMQPDTQGAMPFVDRILYTSFDVHFLAGIAVIAGCAVMLAPALLGLQRDPADRATFAAFGALWGAAIAAAALGNYPTPLVGYGGSAIIGYLLCGLAVARAASSVAREGVEAGGARPRSSDPGSLRLA